MKEHSQGSRRSRRSRFLLVAIALLAIAGIAASTQELVFRLDPQRSAVNFMLGNVLHTVRGTFHLKESSLRLDPASGKVTGEIIVDARSGESGSGMRDRKMHREVLESDRYPEIAFRPDRVDGTVPVQGKSSVRIHGVFAIHGTQHEITVPAEVEVSTDHWTATLHFTVPYEKWGMKNPSTLFLRVNESVEIDLTAAGTITRS
jgi:polyisoprenoid-binding protein YceI